MPTEPELLKAVIAAPDEDAPRLAYAAWCEGQSDAATKARAEFIRLEIGLVRKPYDSRRPPIREWDRRAQLLSTHRTAWSGGLASRVDEFEYYRGFVELVRLRAAVFLECGAALLTMAPVRHVDLTDAKGFIGKLASSTQLGSLLSLGLQRQGLGDAEAEALARSPHLSRLQWLSLSDNAVAEAGVESFCRAENLSRLRVLELEGNPFDPRERCGTENDLITARFLPREAVSLEAVFGPKAWLHGHGETVGDWHPSRFSPAQPS